MSNAIATNATFAEHFSHVEIVETADGSLHVEPIWKGVDRPNVGGWAVGPTHRALAERLCRAVRSGAAFGDVTAKVDVNGATYINASHLVLGRHMNADLRRLGY
jgi:hypothetical protein